MLGQTWAHFVADLYSSMQLNLTSNGWVTNFYKHETAMKRASSETGGRYVHVLDLSLLLFNFQSFRTIFWCFLFFYFLSLFTPSDESFFDSGGQTVSGSTKKRKAVNRKHLNAFQLFGSLWRWYMYNPEIFFIFYFFYFLCQCDVKTWK